MKEPQYQKVAYLDTSALHSVGLYLEYAQKHNLFPWEGQSIHDAETTVRRSTKSKAEKEALKKGFNILKASSTKSLDLQYSAVAQMELTAARVRGKAITEAAREGLPDRIWSRIRERGIRDRVSTVAIARISDGVRDIARMLEEFEFAEGTTTRRQAPGAAELAAQILGLVYMEPLDSLVYSSALLSRADLLFTTDGPFCEMVNEISRPGSTAGGTKRSQFRGIRNAVKNLVAGSYGPSATFELPSAHRITEGGVWKPPLR